MDNNKNTATNTSINASSNTNVGENVNKHEEIISLTNNSHNINNNNKNYDHHQEHRYHPYRQGQQIIHDDARITHHQQRLEHYTNMMKENSPLLVTTHALSSPSSTNILINNMENQDNRNHFMTTIGTNISNNNNHINFNNTTTGSNIESSIESLHQEHIIKVKNEKEKKDDRQQEQKKILRPHNPFFVFKSEQKLKVAAMYPKQNSAQLSKFMGQMWNSLSPIEKDVYVKKAEFLRQEHMRKYPDYKYCPKPRRSKLAATTHQYELKNESSESLNLNSKTSPPQTQEPQKKSGLLSGNHVDNSNVDEVSCVTSQQPQPLPILEENSTQMFMAPGLAPPSSTSNTSDNPADPFSFSTNLNLTGLNFPNLFYTAREFPSETGLYSDVNCKSTNLFHFDKYTKNAFETRLPMDIGLPPSGIIVNVNEPSDNSRVTNRSSSYVVDSVAMNNNNNSSCLSDTNNKLSNSALNQLSKQSLKRTESNLYSSSSSASSSSSHHSTPRHQLVTSNRLDSPHNAQSRKTHHELSRPSSSAYQNYQYDSNPHKSNHHVDNTIHSININNSSLYLKSSNSSSESVILPRSTSNVISHNGKFANSDNGIFPTRHIIETSNLKNQSTGNSSVNEPIPIDTHIPLRFSDGSVRYLEVSSILNMNPQQTSPSLASVSLTSSATIMNERKSSEVSPSLETTSSYYLSPQQSNGFPCKVEPFISSRTSNVYVWNQDGASNNKMMNSGPVAVVEPTDMRKQPSMIFSSVIHIPNTNNHNHHAQELTIMSSPHSVYPSPIYRQEPVTPEITCNGTPSQDNLMNAPLYGMKKPSALINPVLIESDRPLHQRTHQQPGFESRTTTFSSSTVNPNVFKDPTSYYSSAASAAESSAVGHYHHDH